MSKNETDRRLRYLLPDRGYAGLLTQLTRPGAVRYFPFAGFGSKISEQPERRSSRFAVFATLGQELASVEETFQSIFQQSPRSEFSPRGIARLQAALENPLTGINVVIEFLQAFDLPVAAILDRDVLKAVSAVDAYEKRRRRFEISKYLLDEGVELDFYGMGWDAFATHPRARIRGLTAAGLADVLPDYPGLRVCPGSSCG